jgi:hypothetical protein
MAIMDLKRWINYHNLKDFKNNLTTNNKHNIKLQILEISHSLVELKIPT